MNPANRIDPSAFARITGLPPARYSVITPYLVPADGPKRVNAGDGFILDSAIRLIGRKPSAVFSSRTPLSDADISEINAGRALLVAGANTLKDRFEIAPGFDLRMLERIRVPIALMGIGHYGDPVATANGLSSESVALLRAILQRFPGMSVRCDASRRYVVDAMPELADRILMTSCPVAFPVDPVNRKFAARELHQRVVVTITDRLRTDEQLWMLQAARDMFAAQQYVLALHQDYDNKPLWRHATDAGYRVFRSSRYEDFISLYANTDVHFGNRLHAHLKCLSLGVRSYLAPFDLRQRFFAESLDFPLASPRTAGEFRSYGFERFLRARQRAAPDMVRFVEQVRALLR